MPLTPGDGQDLLQRYKQAWERRDPDLAMSLYREDAEHRDHPFHDPYHGANQIRAMWNEIAASETNVDFDAERVWVNGMTVLASFHAAYTDRTNAQRIRIRGFMTVELDDAGLVSRLRAWPASQAVGTDSTFEPDQPARRDAGSASPDDRRTHGR